MPFTLTELKFAGVVALLVAALAGLALFAEHERHSGAATVNAKVAQAVAEQQASQAANLIAQAATSQKVIDEYQAERDAALAARADSAIAAGVHNDALRTSPVPAAAAARPGVAVAPAASGVVSGVPGGAAVACPDDAGVRDLAEAGDLLLALARATQRQTQADRAARAP